MRMTIFQSKHKQSNHIAISSLLMNRPILISITIIITLLVIIRLSHTRPFAVHSAAQGSATCLVLLVNAMLLIFA